MESRHLYRRFKQMGYTKCLYPWGTYRKAKHLKTTDPIGEIGYQLGYTSPSYFTIQFENHTGFSPSEYKNNS
jgi:AraC-like DNA-binding protein